MKLTLDNPILLKDSGIPGKTVAIFAGVHGNEKAGVHALEQLADKLDIKRGKLYLVLANPEAIKANVREVNINLNRLFLKGNTGAEPEDVIARNLMSILDQCDALLDLHASNSKNTKPFIIFNKFSEDISRLMNFEIISGGWSNFHQGSSDEYMETLGKCALCLECGSVFESEKNVPLAIQSIKQFLQYFDLIDRSVEYNSEPQVRLNIFKVGIKETNEFKFSKHYDDFEMLKEGEIFATDGNKKYVAGSNEYIIFPRENKPIGGEVFVLAK